MRNEYNTRQKRELQRFLEKHDMQNFSLDDIVFQLQGEGTQIGRTTVYRTLEALTEQGSVRKYANAQGITQYQHIADSSRCDGHFHLMCKQCGALYHVDCNWMQALTQHIENSHGFQIDPMETMVVGVCAHCRGLEAVDHGTHHNEAGHHCL